MGFRTAVIGLIVTASLVLTGPSSTSVAAAGPTAERFNLVTLAGVLPGDGRVATLAQLRFPTQLAFDLAGNLLITDTHGSSIRRVDRRSHVIRSIAGSPLVFNTVLADGSPAASAGVFTQGVAVDFRGDVFFTDWNSGSIRKVDVLTGLASTVFTNGHNLTGLAFDQGNLYFVDQRVQTIGMIKAGDDHLIHPGAVAVVVAGGGAGLNDGGRPTAGALTGLGEGTVIAFDAGHRLLIPERRPHYRLRRVAPGLSGTVNGSSDEVITTIAGNGSPTLTTDGGPATASALQPSSAAVAPNGDIYVSDLGNAVIRRIDHVSGVIFTVVGSPGVLGDAGDGGPASSALLRHPTGALFGPDGRLYFSDDFNHRVRVVDLASGKIRSVAGRSLGDGGAAGNATLNDALGVDWTAAGEMVIADRLDYRVRKLAGGGALTTIAGFGDSSPRPSPAQLNEGGAALQAMVQNVTDVAIDRAGNVFTAEARLGKVRRVDHRTGLMTTIATGLQYPDSLAFGSDGSLYIAAGGDGGSIGAVVYRVTPGSDGTVDANGDGETTTAVIGTGNYGFGGDGGPASAADLSFIDWMSLGRDGNLYLVVDDPVSGLNCCVRMVRPGAAGVFSGSPSETIVTIAGRLGAGFASDGDGGSATAAAIFPAAVAAAGDGSVYVSDVAAQTIRRIDPSTRRIGAVAGNGHEAPGLDGPALTSPLAGVNVPFVDPSGNVGFTSIDRIRVLASAARVAVERSGDGGGEGDRSGDAVVISVQPQFDVHRLEQSSFRVQAIDPASGEPVSASLAPRSTRVSGARLTLSFDQSSLEQFFDSDHRLNLRALGRTIEGRYVSGLTFINPQSTGGEGGGGGAGKRHPGPTVEEAD